MEATLPQGPLPKGWTIDEIERGLPAKLRVVKTTWQITFKTAPAANVSYDPDYVVEFFARLDLNERDALRAKFAVLVDEGRIFDFKIKSIAVCRANFFDSLFKAIR